MPQLVSVLGGRRDVSLRIDDAGFREYPVVFMVEGQPGVDGPLSVRYNTPGLPLPGEQYQVDSEFDAWAWCRPAAEVIPHPDHRDGDPTRFWQVTLFFSNRPQSPNVQRCQDVQIEDPLQEPMKVSGSFSKQIEEASEDKFGFSITTSSHEVIRGPQVEFETSLPTVKIEQNVAELGIELFAPMVDTVNKNPLWGFGPRCVKLDNVTWDKKFYGQCNIYYTRVLEFSINASTFDRSLLDEGTMVLNGEWVEQAGTREWVLIDIDGQPPDRNNPAHFIRYTDSKNNPAEVVLDGRGEPWIPESRTLYLHPNAVMMVLNSGEGWADEDNAIGSPDLSYAVAPAIPGQGDPENSSLVLSGFGTIPDPQPEIGRVNLRFYSMQEGAGIVGGGMVHEYSLDGSVWVELERVINDRTRHSDYDMSDVLTTWAAIEALQVRVRAELPGPNEQQQIRVDAVELWITPRNRPGSVFVAFYQESDFSLLGIPATL